MAQQPGRSPFGEPDLGYQSRGHPLDIAGRNGSRSKGGGDAGSSIVCVLGSGTRSKSSSQRFCSSLVRRSPARPRLSTWRPALSPELSTSAVDNQPLTSADYRLSVRGLLWDESHLTAGLTRRRAFVYGLAVLLSGAGVPPMVRRSWFRAFLLVESVILGVAGTGATGTLPERSSADGAG